MGDYIMADMGPEGEALGEELEQAYQQRADEPALDDAARRGIKQGAQVLKAEGNGDGDKVTP